MNGLTLSVQCLLRQSFHLMKKNKTIPNKMFNCLREIFVLREMVLAFVKTTIKMIGKKDRQEGDNFVQFSENTRIIMVKHAKNHVVK